MKRGPGARAGRRDYSRLPRFEVFWDFPGGGYCCPECGEPFTPLGDHWSGEQLDWQVIIRLVANCRRRYKRECRCRGPPTVMAPGPPKAIGKGLFTNGFIAMLLAERFAAGRSMNSLVTGLARQGAEISPATLAGTCAQAGDAAGPAGGGDRGAERGTRGTSTRTRRRGGCSRPATGTARRSGGCGCSSGPDTVLLRDGPDPVRGRSWPATPASTRTPGSCSRDEDGGPRRLVISSDFYAVYQSAGKKADGPGQPVLLAHVRRYFVRAGDANPAQLRYWTRAWLDRIRDLYAAHDELMAAWQGAAAPARGQETAAAGPAGEGVPGLGRRDHRDRRRRGRSRRQAPGLQEPAKKALATLDREWDGTDRAPGLPDDQHSITISPSARSAARS